MANRLRFLGYLFAFMLPLSACGPLPTIDDIGSTFDYGSQSTSTQTSRSTSRVSSTAGRPTIAVAFIGDEASNLRAGPGTRFRVIGAGSPGTRIEILNRESGWLEIRNGRSTAWIAERLTNAGTPTAATSTSTNEPATNAGGPIIDIDSDSADQSDTDQGEDDQREDDQSEVEGAIPNF